MSGASHVDGLILVWVKHTVGILFFMNMLSQYFEELTAMTIIISYPGVIMDNSNSAYFFGVGPEILSWYVRPNQEGQKKKNIK